MDIPYILQAIIVLLVFAMFCLGMHCITRSTELFQSHEGFAQDEHNTNEHNMNEQTDGSNTSTTTQPSCPSPKPFPLTACNNNAVNNTVTDAHHRDTSATSPNAPHQHTTNDTNDLEQKRPPPHAPTPPPPSATEDPHGYTIRDPSTWAVPHRRAPVCMPTAHPEVRPVYTDGVPLYALEVKGGGAR